VYKGLNGEADAVLCCTARLLEFYGTLTGSKQRYRGLYLVACHASYAGWLRQAHPELVNSWLESDQAARASATFLAQSWVAWLQDSARAGLLLQWLQVVKVRQQLATSSNAGRC